MRMISPMAVKWIISDVDGCISPEESVAWDFEDFARFARYVRAGNRQMGQLAPMTLCTGRPQPYVEALMKILDITAPAICENGAVIYSLADNHARYAPGVTAQKIAGLRAVRQFIESHLLERFPSALIQYGKEAQISIYSPDPSIFSEMKQQIEHFINKANGPQLLINASHVYLNISLLGVDKGSTLRHLLGMLHINKSQAAGIGDTDGDLPLRQNVGFFACPANATAAIRQAADYVSPYPNLAGMLDILTRPELRCCDAAATHSACGQEG